MMEETTITYWYNHQIPARCCICGEYTATGGRIIGAYNSGGKDDEQTLVLIVCVDCVSRLGELAGQAVAITSADINIADDDTLLTNLIIGYWRGVSQARNRFIDEQYQQLADITLQRSHEEQKASKWEIHATKLEKFLDTEALRTEGDGWVYLMFRDNGDYKIGLSGNPDRRLMQIQRQYPSAQLIHKIKVDDMRQAESILHQEFADKRQDGEWFSLAPIDIKNITNLVRFEDGWFLERKGAIQPMEATLDD